MFFDFSQLYISSTKSFLQDLRRRLNKSFMLFILYDFEIKLLDGTRFWLVLVFWRKKFKIFFPPNVPKIFYHGFSPILEGNNFFLIFFIPSLLDYFCLDQTEKWVLHHTHAPPDLAWFACTNSRCGMAHADDDMIILILF